jgi:4-aminobutyrate aminotransferase
MANANAVGAVLKQRLQELTARHPVVGDVRGLGLMLAVEIVRDRTNREWDPQLRDAIITECFNRGLLVLGAGPSSIRLSPPLVIDEEQAGCAVQILSEAIDAVAA